MANWTRLAAEIAAAEVPDYEIFTSIASLFGLDGLSFNDGDKVIARVSDFFQLDSVPCLALTLFFAGAGSYFSSWLTLEETSQCHCFKRASWGESSGCSSPLNTETFVVFDGRKLVKPTCFQKDTRRFRKLKALLIRGQHLKFAQPSKVAKLRTLCRERMCSFQALLACNKTMP